MKSNVSIVVLVASVIADLNLQGIFKVLRRIDRINKMFSDSVIDIVGFDSCPEEVRLDKCSQNQTEYLEKKDDLIQTVETTSTEVQTASEGVLDFASETVSYDIDKLAVFLKKILPHLEEELKDVASTENDLNTDQHHESVCNYDFAGEAGKVMEFNWKQISLQPECPKDKIISNLTWNVSGVLLAVAFSNDIHEGWCNHEASVVLYNLSENKVAKYPQTRVLKTFSCVTSIAFHPYMPTILAGGFHSGEIMIWDLSSDEEVLLTIIKEKDNEFHTDVVRYLTWKADRNNTMLVTGGRDGKIIFWKVTISTLTFKAKERFVIPAEQLASASSTYNECIEVNCFDFWPDVESDFVVAAGVKILHCSLTTALNVSSLPNYKNPVSLNYMPHKGITTCVSCLSQSDLFASSGIDGEIHIYKFGKTTPLHTIHRDYSIMNVKWINTVSFLSWGLSSAIESHKINMDHIMTVLSNAFEINKNITAVAYSLKRPEKLAVASRMGELLLSDFIL